jgi:hypothetical protein
MLRHIKGLTCTFFIRHSVWAHKDLLNAEFKVSNTFHHHLLNPLNYKLYDAIQELFDKILWIHDAELNVLMSESAVK